MCFELYVDVVHICEQMNIEQFGTILSQTTDIFILVWHICVVVMKILTRPRESLICWRAFTISEISVHSPAPTTWTKVITILLFEFY